MAVAVGLAKRSRSEVGRGRSPCGNDGLRAFSQENDLIRLSRNNASVFREIHLPRAYRPHQRGSADPFSLKTLHRRVFRAFEPLKNVHWTFFRVLDAPEPAASLPGEGFWMSYLPDKSEFAFLNLPTPKSKQYPRKRCLHGRSHPNRRLVQRGGVSIIKPTTRRQARVGLPPCRRLNHSFSACRAMSRRRSRALMRASSTWPEKGLVT